MMSGNVVVVTDASFEQEVMNEPLGVLVDLHAAWCGPCKQMAPVVAKLAQELAGRLKVVSIDIDHNPMCAQMFRASSIPMFVALKGGKVVGHQLGAVPKSALEKLVEPLLGKDDLALDPEALAAMIVGGGARPVDVRDPAAYARYRLPGAINLPTDDLPERKDELDFEDGKLPVLYGRSDEAKTVATQLVSEGILVKYLEGGFLAWEVADLEVEKGPR